MRFKKSTQAMPIALVQHCRQLLQQQRYHRAEFDYYYLLFNSFAPDLDSPDCPPLQLFYQLQAEYHKGALVRIEIQILNLEAA